MIQGDIRSYLSFYVPQENVNFENFIKKFHKELFILIKLNSKLIFTFILTMLKLLFIYFIPIFSYFIAITFSDYISGGLHWLLLCKSFNVSCVKYLFIHQTKSNSLSCRILMYNIMFPVKKALLAVLTMCFVTMGRHVVLCFQHFVQYLDQTLEKVLNALRTFFIHS